MASSGWTPGAPSQTEGYASYQGAPIALNDVERGLVSPHLAPDEKVLWVGHPNPGKLFTSSDRFFVPFSLLWAGFSVYWEAGAATEGAGTFLVLWGVPFVLVGAYIVFGRFIYKAWRKKRTAYVVTGRRVMSIFAGRRGEAVEASYLHALPGISTKIGPDGSGNVIFGKTTLVGSFYANTGMEFFSRGSFGDDAIGFYDIPDARHVADLVDQLREQQSRPEL